MRYAFRIASQRERGRGKAGAGFDQVRRNLQRGEVLVPRLLGLALQGQGAREVAARERQARIQRKRALEIGERILEPPLSLIHDAKIDVGIGVAGRHRHSTFEPRACVAQIVLAQADDAEIERRVEMSRLEAQDRFKRFARPPRVPRFRQRPPEVQVASGVLRIQRDGVPQQRQRFGGPALLEYCDGEPHERRSRRARQRRSLAQHSLRVRIFTDDQMRKPEMLQRGAVLRFRGDREPERRHSVTRAAQGDAGDPQNEERVGIARGVPQDFVAEGLRAGKIARLQSLLGLP